MSGWTRVGDVLEDASAPGTYLGAWKRADGTIHATREAHAIESETKDALHASDGCVFSLDVKLPDERRDGEWIAR